MTSRLYLKCSTMPKPNERNVLEVRGPVRAELGSISNAEPIRAEPRYSRDS